MDKKKLFAYAILLIFFGSTIAAAFIQSLSQGSGPASQPKLPEKMKNSEYTPAEEAAIMSSGATLVSYSYNPSTCLVCGTTKATIQTFAETKPDVFVSFSESESQVVSIKSVKNSVILTRDISEESLTDAYCEVTNAQSDTCVLRQV